jgi:hypothetical protein
LSRLCLTFLAFIMVDGSTNSLGDSSRNFRVGIGGSMTFDAAIADGSLSRWRLGWSKRIAFALAAVAVSLVVAAWITDSDLPGLASAALPENTDRISSFEDRFFPASMAASAADSAPLHPLDRSALGMVGVKISTAQSLIGPQSMPRDLRAGFSDSEAPVVAAKPTVAGAIPLPRSRPVAADLEARPGSSLAQTDSAGRPDDRTMLQKLSDLLPPGRLMLASLAPDGGLFHRGPDLASLGYDSLTAVYDISAHSVYLPNGLTLEAHSGMGSLRDDPEHVSVPNAGATPPAVYQLKPREKEFHGVQALRMIPAEGSDTSGRSGLLTHSFMLGPKGDSNGCVSIRDYDRFLKAFNDGQINRLVVVPSLRGGTLASQRPTSQS